MRPIRVLPLLFLAACGPRYDLVIRGGTVYDGTGAPGVRADVAVLGDSVVAVGDLGRVRATTTVDATGLAVAPGFINMMNHAEDDYMVSGRSESDIRQGVTLEVMGEGGSIGPVSDSMRVIGERMQGDIKYPITWRTLGEAMDTYVAKGLAPNLASFVGASTVREVVLGDANRAPTPAELDSMRAVTAQAMEDGAMGLGSALIYAPGFYAKTDELVELSKVVSRYGGMYISHIRSEGNTFEQAVDELMTIAREAKVPAEIYHLKASGVANWPKMDRVLAKVDSARAAGLPITADLYTYPAGATGLDAVMPPWVQEGGYEAWRKRLMDPVIRARVLKEMRTPSDAWENFLLLVESPEKIMLVAFKNDSLKPLTGKTLAEVAKLRGKSPEETAMDLVVEDGSRVGTIYFMISEDNIRKQIRKPWVSLGSDAGSESPEGVFLKFRPHPRTYGTFARFLGKYVRDEKLIPLEEGIRRLTSLPATNMKIRRRGQLAPGFHADIVVFDPATIQDHATFEKPQQFATGVRDVFVNGVAVLREGRMTGATPGRVVRGPGWKGWKAGN